jgi:hypothetical protein
VNGFEIEKVTLSNGLEDEGGEEIELIGVHAFKTKRFKPFMIQSYLIYAKIQA